MKLEFWKEGHARRKLGDSSQRAARLQLFASLFSGLQSTIHRGAPTHLFCPASFLAHVDA